MGVVVACVGRPGGRVMTVFFTADDGTWEKWPPPWPEHPNPIPRLSWKEWQHELRANDPHEAESIDGDWRMPATRPSLASLHANPAHSALRRARCFHETSVRLDRRYEAMQRHISRCIDTTGDWCIYAEDALTDACDAASEAHSAALRSVR